MYDIDQPALDNYVNGTDPTAPDPGAGFNGADRQGNYGDDGGVNLSGPEIQAAAGVAGGLDDTGPTVKAMSLPDATGDTTANGALNSQFPNPGFGSGTSIPGADAEPSVANATAGIPGFDTGAATGLPNANDTRWNAANVPAPGDGTAFAGGTISGFPAGGTAPATPTLPNSGTTAAAPPTGTGPGQLSPSQWQQDFTKDMGFYSNQFNDKADFLGNALRGDMVIRGYDASGQRTGPDQLAEMAKYDVDAKRVLDTINATPDFYRSQNTADWIGQHNQQIANTLGQYAGGAQGAAPGAFNGALHGQPQRGATGQMQLSPAQQNLIGQAIPTIGSPMDNAHALLSTQTEKVLTDALNALGATNIQRTYDPYGNGVISYNNRSGQQETIRASLADMANAVATLQQRATAANAAAPAASAPASGGGYPPRAAAPRSTFTPAPRGNPPPQAPAAAPPPASNGGAFSYGSVGGYPNVASSATFQNPTTPGGAVTAPQHPLLTPQEATIRNNGMPVPY